MQKIETIKKSAGRILKIHRESIRLKESFLDMAARFANDPGTVLLMSGGDLDCARYHILGINPWLTYSGRAFNLEIEIKNEKFLINDDPFDILKNLISSFHLEITDSKYPLESGLLGYLAYDLKDGLEKLPRTSVDDLGLPHICLYAHSLILIHDKINNETHLFVPERSIHTKAEKERILGAFYKRLESKPVFDGGFRAGGEGLKSGFTHANYLKTVEKIRDYIAAGHIYQVNLSQRFEIAFEGDPFSLFKALYENNPAPFFAYINAENHQVISTSPERFIFREHNRVEARPIKGTRPRGKTADEDERLKQALLESRKDDAELSMIVDLLRNDIGKVCAAGSVKVAQHKRLEAYQNVYHLVSVVEGDLDKGKDTIDLIKATFPGGSITGCPKIRSMEIIDELEPVRRHIYTGSIGYISFHDTMDLSIAIRTATVLNKKLIFSVGGAIVFDSDPSAEYDETLHKGRTFIDLLNKKKMESSISTEFIWKNGMIQPAHTATISVMDEGFLYGYGFFETIRVDRGKPILLNEHLERFHKTWNILFRETSPDLTWDEIIGQVISENRLEDKIAAVKMLAAKANRQTPPRKHTLMVSARPYTHRLATKKVLGLSLATYPHPRQTPLADHKTLNYLFYLLAGKWAAEQGADEAIILNPDGTISETNTGNIFLITEKSVTIPKSPHVLPGIMGNAVCELLQDWGYGLKTKKVKPDALLSADLMIVTNSLMGAVPVLAIDGKRIKANHHLYQKINETLFSGS